MQFIDLKTQFERIEDDVFSRVSTVLQSQKYVMGPEIAELEEKLAEYAGVRHAISCSSGTDALVIPLMGYDLKATDAVFVPSFTFFASAESITLAGGTPVFVDSDATTFNLSPADLDRAIDETLAEGKLTPRGIITVDLFGQPADYDEILAIADKHGLFVIEDAAQGFGGEYKGAKAGSFGNVASTSFFPAKPLGCYGDGGAIFTDDDHTADLIRSLCVHGKGPGGKYDNVRVGMNSRLDAMQAAVLLPKLKALGDYEIDARQQVVERYGRAFAGKLTTPFVAEGCVSGCAQYALLAADTAQRDKIVAHLKEAGIPNMIYYPTPQHALPVFWDEPHYGETFRNADDYCARTFSLPMHPYLEQAEQRQIIDAVLEAL